MEIILDTKFQHKLTILIFWTNFSQKEYFRLKTEEVKITIEFFGIFCLFDEYSLICTNISCFSR